MIKIFKADALLYTPFVKSKGFNFLAEQGIVITENKADCNLFVAQKCRNLIPFQLKYGARKEYLVWSHEPRWDTHFTSKVKWFNLPTIHVMNVYTGDIYLNNYYTVNSNGIQTIDRLLKPFHESNFSDFEHKKVAALMFCRNHRYRWSLKRDGKELDLCYLRTRIALQGHNLGRVDVYGRGWPKGISLEDSRGEGWEERKARILRNYHFNLCFENTNTDYYCTEKIWDSIKHGCLPIYYGQGNKIYEDFPPNSFLDYCDFGSPDLLFKYIDAMTVEEFRARINLCIDAYNQAFEKLKASSNSFYEEMLLKIVQKANAILANSAGNRV
ncbi:MAG: glycosyl transferase [Leptolyngbyaceae cyanobacterium SL_5_9]|nr:glycosyl transferase [Leptolyngbyaceae cyanobacterium SL_5_9]